jgi:hypothetical protein
LGFFEICLLFLVWFVFVCLFAYLFAYCRRFFFAFFTFCFLLFPFCVNFFFSFLFFSFGIGFGFVAGTFRRPTVASAFRWDGTAVAQLTLPVTNHATNINLASDDVTNKT